MSEAAVAEAVCTLVREESIGKCLDVILDLATYELCDIHAMKSCCPEKIGMAQQHHGHGSEVTWSTWCK